MKEEVKRYLLSKLQNQPQSDGFDVPAEEDQFSQDNYNRVVQQSKDEQGKLAIAQLAAGFGDALARKDSANTDRFFDSRREQINDSIVGDFNRRKANQMNDLKLDQQKKMIDPNSQESINFRNLVQSTMPNIAKSYGDKWNKVAAADQDSILNFGKMREQLDARTEMNQQNKIAKQALAEQKANIDKGMKASQALAMNYGKRLEQSQNIFDELANGGYDRSDWSSGIGATMPNVIKSKEAQMQEQAERNFVNAVLRRESGAAIAPSEFESAEKQYFPRAGDSEEVINQKRNNRQQVLESLKAEAGNAWNKVDSIKSSNNSFPRTVKKDGMSTTVDNEKELKEAQEEGWK